MELIQSGNRLSPARLNAAENGVKVFATSGTMSSGTYVNLPAVATASFPVTKYSAASELFVTMKILAFADAGSTGLRLGVLINSTDYDVALGYYTAANTYLPTVGFAYIAAGLAAGTYTVQPRWRRTVGAGLITTNSGISELDVSVREVA